MKKLGSCHLVEGGNGWDRSGGEESSSRNRSKKGKRKEQTKLRWK